MYVGLGVHSKNAFCVILDEEGHTVAECSLDNDVYEFAWFFTCFDHPSEDVGQEQRAWR